ncbi:hypothetical protein ACFL6C_08100, partial [Myxococcota bacterium]
REAKEDVVREKKDHFETLADTYREEKTEMEQAKHVYISAQERYDALSTRQAAIKQGVPRLRDQVREHVEAARNAMLRMRENLGEFRERAAETDFEWVVPILDVALPRNSSFCLGGLDGYDPINDLSQIQVAYGAVATAAEAVKEMRGAAGGRVSGLKRSIDAKVQRRYDEVLAD